MQTIMATEDDALDTPLLIPSTFNKCIVSNVDLGGTVSTVRTVPTMSLVELGKKLLASARDGDTEQVQLLMSKGAPFTTDWLGTSPLHLAAQNGHLATAEVLIRAGISRDTRTKVDRTPLHLAAQEGNTDIVRLLIANGAQVDAKDMLRMTPLHWAVEREHVDTIEVLLQHGANPHELSKFEKTAFDIAMDNNRSDIIQLLHSVSAVPMSSSQGAATLQHNLETEEATLAATQSLALEMTQVPAPSQQEEVQTSATGATTNSEAELPVFQLGHSEGISHEASVEPEKIIIHSTKTKADFNKPESASPRKTGISWHQRRIPQPQNSSPTLQLLQAHGITMLPADETTLVASAVESGQTVVLTEAGKLALNLTQGSVSGTEIRKSPGTAAILQRKPTSVTLSPNNKKKFITIRAGQILSKTGPNILKRIDPSGSGGPPRKVILTRGGIPIATTAKPVTNNMTLTSAADLEAITRQLEEARREAEEYKKLYSRKEREAEEYKQQLQSITQGGK